METNRHDLSAIVIDNGRNLPKDSRKAREFLEMLKNAARELTVDDQEFKELAEYWLHEIENDLRRAEDADGDLAPLGDVVSTIVNTYFGGHHDND